MASVSHRSSRRRTISEINMVPFIDVMLVLLIIFMVTAPMITTAVVDLPSVGGSSKRPERVIEIVVAADEQLKMRIDGKDAGTLTLADVGARVKSAQAGSMNSPVVISADKGVQYDVVVRVMATLRSASVEKVGLLVKQGKP